MIHLSSTGGGMSTSGRVWGNSPANLLIFIELAHYPRLSKFGGCEQVRWCDPSRPSATLPYQGRARATILPTGQMAIYALAPPPSSGEAAGGRGRRRPTWREYCGNRRVILSFRGDGDAWQSHARGDCSL